ncbi:MAG: peptide chain release factor 1 [Oscillatoriales cyanobacterium RU_3_3]|nr:peptide chain release factor 1 [Microcoleus sp. SU_5_6]NJM62806.1 peptide chain release factor 1 [Oscillatoriales cyanobacterium RU_3_3]NJR24908.1 peptide chain release factor 1 [Richelia sp. CSU_2_1]NJS42271.1 peptide chain release factor 1 [Candidatus Gracilibacteria bacterium]
MNDILRRLKLLPWREMLQISALSNLIVIGIELFLAWGAIKSPAVGNALGLLFRSPLHVFIPCITAMGMGALAVYFFEFWQQQFLLSRGSLWALILCLLLGLFLKSLLLPPFLISLSETALIGVAIGVFWKGKPYW